MCVGGSEVLDLMGNVLSKRYSKMENIHENLCWILSDDFQNSVLQKNCYYSPEVKCYKEGGYTLWRSKNNKVLIGIDHADLGFGSLAAHGHADALSFQMFIEGVPVFVDPGTYNYHVPKKTRDEFRATKNHNTVCVNDQNQAEILGPFLWGKRYKINNVEFDNECEKKCIMTAELQNSSYVHAASCGSTKYDELPLEVATCIRETFKRISAFSARDMNTHEFISRLTGKKISDNLDPVLIYDFSNEVNKVKKLPKLPEHYCIIYSYYNRIHKPEEIDTIKRFCDKHNLTPIAIGSPQFWLKNYVTCSPFQCLKIFQNADFVITDTFHGTIFAAKYAPKYAVLIRDSNRNKLLDLIKKIKIEKHLIENMEEIEEKFSCKKDIVGFQKIIEMERRKTSIYLEQEIRRQKD